MPTASSTEPRSISSSVTRPMMSTVARSTDTAGIRRVDSQLPDTMGVVPNTGRMEPGKTGRSMSADHDAQQPELWDTSELERLAHLRQLAASSSAPDEVRRVIDRAATADEAIDLLSGAGLMPADADPVGALLTWFAPLLEPGL